MYIQIIFSNSCYTNYFFKYVSHKLFFDMFCELRGIIGLKVIRLWSNEEDNLLSNNEKYSLFIVQTIEIFL